MLQDARGLTSLINQTESSQFMFHRPLNVHMILSCLVKPQVLAVWWFSSALSVTRQARQTQPGTDVLAFLGRRLGSEPGTRSGSRRGQESCTGLGLQAGGMVKAEAGILGQHPERV